jgi:hypothetical protein
MGVFGFRDNAYIANVTILYCIEHVISLKVDLLYVCWTWLRVVMLRV